MHAGQLCNREVVICTPDLSLLDAAQLMREHHVGCLVVVERSDGSDPIGLTTDRDLVVEGVAAAASFATMTVSEVMTSELITAREDEDVATVLARMRSFGVRRMPIVDERRGLRGILAYDDLVEWVAEQLTGLTRIVRTELRREERRFGADEPPTARLVVR